MQSLSEKTNCTPRNQYGHTCKIVAIECLDTYWGQKLNFQPIYKYKNTHKHYTETEIPTQSTSIRQIAKKYGSKQGELLQIDQFGKIFTEIGYSSKIVSFENDIKKFESTIRENINKRQPIIGFFAVSQINQLPTTDYKDNEHACVICGYSEDNGDFFIDIIHWNKKYTRIPLENFYNSAMVLPETREQEHYYKITDRNRKYQKLTDQKLPPNAITRDSIIPENGSGFRGKLIVVDTPSITKESRSRLFTTKPNQKIIKKDIDDNVLLKKILMAFLGMCLIPLITLLVGACCNTSPVSIGLFLAIGCLSSNLAVIALCVGIVLAVAAAGYIGYNCTFNQSENEKPDYTLSMV